MAGFNYQFDATNIPPEQFGGAHPVGRFPAQVINTSVEPSSTFEGGNFVVDFQTPAGTIKKWYSLWHPTQKTVDGAHKQLSALSHATGVFKLDMNNEGAALRGAQCMLDIVKQEKKKEDDPDRTQIQKVLDRNGNEPGKAPAPTNQAAAFGTQPSQPANNAAGQFGAGAGPAPNAATASPAPANAWGAQVQQPAAQQPQTGFGQQPQQGWQQGGATAGATDKPPWVK